MRITRAHLTAPWMALLIGLLGCKPAPSSSTGAPRNQAPPRRTSSPPGDTTARRPPPVRPGTSAAVATPHGCRADADCVATCAQGAVSRTWWKVHRRYYYGCEDGCASKGYTARCVSSTCTTFRRRNNQEQPVPACTRRPLPTNPPLKDLPYACKRDADCVTDCAQGAVNTYWLQAHRPELQRCKDGCASKGFRARCVQRICVAFNTRGAKQRRVDHCTRRPARWTRK